jgi:uncharacterized LabA/DUF88 family protein
MPDTNTNSEYVFLDIDEKTALFIDGVSTHAVARNLGWTIDFKRLQDYFARYTRLVKSYYFTPMDVHDESQIGNLIEWLSLNGFICKLVGYDSGDERGKKTNIDVTFVDDILGLAYVPNAVDHFILFTGAGKYTPIVRKLDTLGKKVTICSTVSINRSDAEGGGKTKMISHDLRKAADNFIDLGDIKKEVERLNWER